MIFIHQVLDCNWRCGAQTLPNEKMLLDQFTKPLQGEQLRKFRSELLKVSEDTNMSGMVWDGIEEKKGVSWKLHNESDTACS